MTTFNYNLKCCLDYFLSKHSAPY